MSDTANELLVTLRKILRAISLRSKKIAQTSGLTMPQLLVLRELEKFETLTVGVLSQNVSLSQATVTAILDRLERKGLVTRERSQIDRRRVMVTLSIEGRVALERAPSALQDDFSEAFDKLEEWEQTLLLSSLQRVASMMKATALPQAPLYGEEQI